MAIIFRVEWTYIYTCKGKGKGIVFNGGIWSSFQSQIITLQHISVGVVVAGRLAGRWQSWVASGRD